jgi:hypothetical protein
MLAARNEKNEGEQKKPNKQTRNKSTLCHGKGMMR